MIDLIESHRADLEELCARFKVERLDVFGSASKGGFVPASSDLDFVVRFWDRTPGTYAWRYLDFADALEALFGRPVDLLTERSVRNPYFIRELQATRQTVYEQRH